MKYKANAKEMVYKRRGNQTYRGGAHRRLLGCSFFALLTVERIF